MTQHKPDESEKTADSPASPGSTLGGSQLLTIEEVSRYLQLRPETVRAMARERAIPAFKIRRRWRFRQEDVEVWVQKIAEKQ
jgi:excisionase family DNA binding protein